MPTVYIVLLNWNGWHDTIECLESVFHLRHPDFKVVVCDNASVDGSIERIKAWARGEISVGIRSQKLAFLTEPPTPKPILHDEVSIEGDSRRYSRSSARLILIQTGGNLGFAGGNNVGLRYALAQQECEFVWLLNNDTVVDTNALSALVERMSQRPDAGICGSTLLFYDKPDLVQALGGSVYNRWTARGGHIGMGWNSGALPGCDAVESRMKYVLGASMLVRRSFLEEIGLISEVYFLYFEEIDWSMRARGRYSLAYAPRSVVFHKEGRSIGTSADRAKRSAASEYYAARGRMLFTKRYFPVAGLIVGAALIGGSLFRCLAGNWPNARAILCGLRDSLRNA